MSSSAQAKPKEGELGIMGFGVRLHHCFTAEAIARYSQNFVPVGFHLDSAKAAKGLFGQRAAPGFHT